MSTGNLEVVDSTLTEDVEGDDGTFLTAEMIEDELVVDAVAGGGTMVDADDFVAHHEAHLLGGAAVDDGAHHDGVGHNLEADANALEVAVEAFVGTLDILGGDVDAVGVEGLEDSVDGLGGKSIHVGGLGVVAVDETHHLVESCLTGGDGVGEEGGLGN